MGETTRERAIRLRKTEQTYVTGLEAARIKGVSAKAVYEAIQKGRLVSVRMGNYHVINRKDLEKWTLIGHNPPKRKRHYAWMDQEPYAENIEALLEDDEDE